MLRRVAGQLEAAAGAGEGEALGLEEAAEVSGYSQSQLRRLLTSGAVTNLGDASGPRIRRGDLPRKPGQLTAAGRARAAERQLRIS
jgi:hypothetical protein